MKKAISLVLVVSLCITVDIAKADFTFGTPINLGPIVNSPVLDSQPSISADGLSLFFYSEQSGGYGNGDIWIARRATKNDDWTMVENIGSPINTSYRDSGPDISADGLTLFFNSDRPGGSGDSDIWVATRTTKSDAWDAPVNLGPTVNSSSYDAYPSLSADGLTLFMQSNRPGGNGRYDIWMTTRQTKDDPWTKPVNLGLNINSSAIDGDPSISPDNLVLLFTSLRPGGYGISDMYMVRRTTKQDSWDSPINLGPIVNSPSIEAAPCISTDGLTICFDCERPGGEGSGDLWQSQIIPIVDFNADGIVDAADMCIIVDYWGTDNPLCDIGPMPWGDGTVDVEDLKVLAEYLFGDMQCVAHFKLDEAKGSIANDSARNRDGTVHGNPQWQPAGGVIGGALQLDGFDDYVKTGFVLNPADGELSVFAWTKGGTPGQVILSQMGGINWLCTDPSEGNLMTELKGTGRAGKPLQSQTNITDGNWHRIGLVWDGSNRTLYVDNVAVAQDTQDVLEGSNTGLYIGTGKATEPGTFFSGLIDDIRIYNRALHP